ncbi:hypothetical protein [Kitasatospora cheerisanensis]|uniref:Uncharacterized protein n=1 Tax=Kitasatospora cheerisanensis KCTC 2395 TaxID=1348663 RepID=A0A066Z5R3_9ACTN|nr:hypothetical protein [Kitasatospora cheerisanensis]KDN85656.1 hypothetical protein KCH_25650 [Kitasatospora cheerisanensis KCTC 2395]
MTNTQMPPAAAVERDPHWKAKMARLRARRLAEKTVSFCDDDAAKAAVGEATIGLATARAAAKKAADDEGVPEEDRAEWVERHPLVVIAQSVAATAQQRLADATVTLTFRALPRPVWRQLLEEHAPTEEQADKGMEYNVETFPAALVAACHIERDPDGTEVPGMSVEDAQELLDDWSEIDAKALFTAALMPNQTLRGDLGKG